MDCEKDLIESLLNLAFAEDIGDGDHTTLCCIPATQKGKVQLIIKEEGVLAGVEVAKKIFHKFDSDLKIETFISDGAKIKPGDIAFTVEGKEQSLLQTERIVLNVMQRMSGIATQTARYTSALEGYKTKVLDTRKTTPGLRMLEKQAVKIGGGVNHRIGLFDMILLKDNHVDFAGGIENAIKKAQNYIKEKGKNLKIEIEVRNFDELNEVLRIGGVDRIMLDNFTPEKTKEAVQLIAGRYETESSGGITFDTLRDYAECGVDYISVGALTHSVKSLDMNTTYFMTQNAVGNYMVTNITNVELQQVIEQVRLAFDVDGTLMETRFADASAHTVAVPRPVAPEGKVFKGWATQTVGDDGKITRTIVFVPGEGGIAQVPVDLTLEPMTLYAVFEAEETAQ